MKKFVLIIIILLIIFIVMAFNRNMSIKASNINIQEIEQIEEYINEIYIEKEIAQESLPCFENINQANEKWIWEVVKKNIEDNNITYEQIQEKAKEIFGENFTKEFPKEGTQYLIYNKETQMYEPIVQELDNEGGLFLLNKIKQTKQGYEIEIVEYIEDYSPMLDENQEDYIIIKNLSGEEISRASGANSEETTDIVKRNIEKFSKKKIVIKKQNEKLYIEKVY